MRRGNQRVEVHVAGICLREEGGIEVLVGKRVKSTRLYPGLWECGGGKVKKGESFEDAVKRELEEEFGVLVSIVAVTGTYKIVLPGDVIPGVKFLCRVEGYVNGKGVQADETAFSEWEWLPISKLGEKEFIPGIPEDIEKAVRVFGRSL